MTDRDWHKVWIEQCEAAETVSPSQAVTGRSITRILHRSTPCRYSLANLLPAYPGKSSGNEEAIGHGLGACGAMDETRDQGADEAARPAQPDQRRAALLLGAEGLPKRLVAQTTHARMQP